MGKTDGCRLEISKISESQPNFLPAKGITIATFTSAFEPNELTDYFKSFNKNFLVFDLSEEVSGYNFENKVIGRDLFGFINASKKYLFAKT